MKLIKLALAAALSLLLAEQSLAGPLEEAKRAYDNRDYSTALGIWHPLADAGNAEAQRFVGILYDNGLAVSRDGREAADWFRKAAAKGDAQAEYRLGMKLVHGADGVTRDVSQGLSLMERAGEHGYIHSFYYIADLYRTGGWGVPEDAAQSMVWFRKAADQGDAASQTTLGIDYQYGRGVTKNIDQAISWYRKAAAQGDVTAQQALAELGQN